MAGGGVRLRIDAGPAIGLGHRARGRALAAALGELGIATAWAGRRDPALAPELAAPGALVLPGPPGPSLDADDGAATGRWAAGADWLVVDHLGADASWAAAVRAAAPGLRLAVVDDHQRRDWADLRIAPTQGDAAKTLAGPDWLPIDPAFAAARDRHPRDGILLFFSRNDPSRLLAPVLAELRPRAGDRPLTVIADDAAAARDGLDGLLAGWPAGGRRIADGDGRMPGLLARAAAVGCSASTIAWEALAAGTPVAALVWIDNQAASAAALAARGVPVAADPAGLAAALSGLPGTAPPAFAGDGARRLARVLANGPPLA
jgi:UDP-2,4-diacetamido-2,4,6-trideoxy-beta-L-altropyranose hydrolase